MRCVAIASEEHEIVSGLVALERAISFDSSVDGIGNEGRRRAGSDKLPQQFTAACAADGIKQVGAIVQMLDVFGNPQRVDVPVADFDVRNVIANRCERFARDVLTVSQNQGIRLNCLAALQQRSVRFLLAKCLAVRPCQHSGPVVNAKRINVAAGSNESLMKLQVTIEEGCAVLVELIAGRVNDSQSVERSIH